MKLLQGAALAIMVGAAGAASSAPERQAVTGPVAVYWMSADTESGMGAGQGGGQFGMGGAPAPPHRPSVAEMMAMQRQGEDPRAAMMRQYEGGEAHLLTLQLGSTRKATGEPTAEHDPPDTLGAGAALPLVTPTQAPLHEDREPGQPPPQYRPHGRLLIYWGCGEHAGPNQPLVIDLSDPARSGAQIAGLAKALAISTAQPPSPARFATYGEWPNSLGRTTVPPNGSLQGEHHVHGNYSPDIQFSLAAEQDFLPPIQMTTNQKTPSGAVALGWRRVDGAQGFIASAFGGQEGQTVMWTSSAVEAFAFALPEYLSDREIARLVASHVLLPGDATSCTAPAEAARAMGTGAFRLVAYGGETNIAYPPRPPAPKPWRIDWQVKVRYRAATAGILGMDVEQMMHGGGQGSPPQQRPHGSFNPFGF